MVRTFLDGFSKALEKELLRQIKSIWTHNSTAIEGNTLTLGETDFILTEGLTISGKSIREHEEVYGHARAIDLVLDLVKSSENFSVDENYLFNLHRAVQTNIETDVLSPVGSWKIVSNYVSILKEDKFVNMEYPRPGFIPKLMEAWINEFNQRLSKVHKEEDILDIYTKCHLEFVTIHPFSDGNGRMARLLSNIPVIKSGYPPVVIQNKNRSEYLKIISEFSGRIENIQNLKDYQKLHENNFDMKDFKDLCSNEWLETIKLVKTFKDKQKEENKVIASRSR